PRPARAGADPLRRSEDRTAGTGAASGCHQLDGRRRYERALPAHPGSHHGSPGGVAGPVPDRRLGARGGSPAGPDHPAQGSPERARSAAPRRRGVDAGCGTRPDGVPMGRPGGQHSGRASGARPLSRRGSPRIEAALAAHPAVRAAAVRVQAGPDGRPRVVAHLVPQDTAGESAPGLEDGLVERWQTLWELLYAGPDGADPAFDVRGWMNSYTREPLPVAEMRDWVERTVDAIASLRPRRLLEIGVGSGLLLYRLAPSCEQYWAVDFCAGAVRRIAAEVAGRGLSDRVRLLHRRADDLDDLPRDFDCVVLNSVVQY